jgi:flavin-binding protein dodecin
MPDSVYKIIELVGTSTDSWEKTAKSAVDMAAKSLRIFGLRRSKSWMCSSRTEKSRPIE